MDYWDKEKGEYMRIPNPKAVTTTEAYLAYKAEVLEQSELKDKLYHPYLHIDGWLAYWTGLTETYPTDKNGDPECLTDEEAYIAYLAGVTSEYPEVLKNPTDVRVASYLRYLISVRFGRPDYPVTREELYLSMMKPSFIPSGDPSSEIELDGTVEAPFIDLKMYGDTFQQTYSGKNKLPPTADFSEELNGVTFSGSNGVYPIKGTATAGTTFTNQPFLRGYTIQSGDYLNFCNATTNANSSLRIIFTDNTSSTPSPAPANRNFSLESFVGKTVQSISWYCANGTAIDMTLSPMITQSSAATVADFEPYVGGTASPNPDYPQAINVVTGEQTVWVHGKNLRPNYTVTSTGAIYRNDNSLFYWLKAGTYTVSYQYSGTSTNNRPLLYLKDSSYNSITTGDIFGPVPGITKPSYQSSVYGWGYGSGKLAELTFELLIDCYVQIVVQNATMPDMTNMQVESGSATTYEPYQSTTKTIDLGSIELCKIGTYQDYIYKSGDDWYVHKATAKTIFNGTESWQYVGGDHPRFTLNKSDLAFGENREGSQPVAFSTQFKGSDILTIYNNIIDNAIAGHHSVHQFWVKADSFADATALETWFTTHNAIAYYALATPTDTKITDATLIGQLDDLMEGGSYNGKTYIKVTATDPNLPGLLYVEAAI